MNGYNEIDDLLRNDKDDKTIKDYKISENDYIIKVSSFNRHKILGVSKSFKGFNYDRNIRSPRDILKYRLFSIRLLIALKINKGFYLFHFLPKDNHDFNVMFKEKNNIDYKIDKFNDLYCFKSYFVFLMRNLIKLDRTFNDIFLNEDLNLFNLDIFLNKDLIFKKDFRDIYSRYDHLFKTLYRFDPVYLGLFASLEFRIKQNIDKYVPVSLINDLFNINLIKCKVKTFNITKNDNTNDISIINSSQFNSFEESKSIQNTDKEINDLMYNQSDQNNHNIQTLPSFQNIQNGQINNDINNDINNGINNQTEQFNQFNGDYILYNRQDLNCNLSNVVNSLYYIIQQLENIINNM